MDSSEVVCRGPVSWSPSEILDVDDVRPAWCRVCRHPARDGTRIVLHGHGVRSRQVVVAPARGQQPAVVTECWTRRFRCTNCCAVLVVLPRGVMPRYLYSVPAIVLALWLTAESPVGGGLSDADAYARQGMYRTTGWTGAWPYRWRSLDRWAAVAVQTWWPSASATAVSALLVTFAERSGTGDCEHMLEVAVAMHVRWGGAM